MKRILMIFLCCIAAFTSVLFFGCSNSSKVDNLGEQTPAEIIDNNNNNDFDYTDNNNQVDSEDSQTVLSLSQYKVQATTTVNIRAQASTSSEVLGQLHNFESLPLIAKNNNWYQVYYNQQPAYISASYANIIKWNNPTQYLVSGLEVQALGNINIRQQPSTTSQVLGKLTRLQHIPLIEKYSENWYKVLYQGKIAYISANPQYTRVYDPEKIDALIENIITEGQKVLGVPYEYGAQRLFYHNGKPNPNFTGNTFDCSSFVQYSFYKGAKIILKADSRSQSQEGILIDKSELERGDLIFMWSSARRYNTGIERIGHVVIYLGDNKILHTWGTGGVRIQEYTPGWQERFILARRML